MALILSNLWMIVALASIVLLLFLIKNAQLKVGELVALIATLAFIVLALSRSDF
ncbi:MAG: hypothetical protein GX342_02985 [Alcaligenaceae bacterium]|mgnify:CR=1 FL=1|nr:hypothetical protein [Alcaligenaceae bacterium]